MEVRNFRKFKYQLQTFMKPKTLFNTLITFAFIGLVIYYFYPIDKIPSNIVIDKIIVHKAKHNLVAYSKGKIVVCYKVAIGKAPIGEKQYEGDLKTPEGEYIIDSKNPNSSYHKNLGISYPNLKDISIANKLGKPTGGDIKIHGLNNSQGYIGKFQRWKDWTNGCIALTNDEIDELYSHTPIGTKIEILK